MKQESIQKQKQLTFAEICPKWNEALELGPGPEFEKRCEVLGITFMSCKRCPVGEAHGFSQEYRPGKSKACSVCNSFSVGHDGQGNSVSNAMTFVSVDDGRRNVEVEEAFAKHWNEVHAK